jgi:anti-sigma B factor antagonist
VTLEAVDDDGVRVLRGTGEVDVTAVPALLPGLPALVDGARAVVLDLSAVTFFDSSGVRLVDRLVRACDDLGSPFRIAAPPGSIGRQVLKLVGMVDGLVCSDLAAARQAVLDQR